MASLTTYSFVLCCCVAYSPSHVSHHPLQGLLMAQRFCAWAATAGVSERRVHRHAVVGGSSPCMLRCVEGGPPPQRLHVQVLLRAKGSVLGVPIDKRRGIRWRSGSAYLRHYRMPRSIVVFALSVLPWSSRRCGLGVVIPGLHDEQHDDGDEQRKRKRHRRDLGLGRHSGRSSLRSR